MKLTGKDGRRPKRPGPLRPAQFQALLDAPDFTAPTPFCGSRRPRPRFGIPATAFRKEFDKPPAILATFKGASLERALQY
jgi:hypothetical protein